LLIDKKQLKELIPVIAAQRKFRPAIVEKDYYLTVILNNIESMLTDKIVFKGGTLLNKVHLNYHRLSEDLDFTYRSTGGLDTRSQRSRAIEPIRDKMPEFLRALGLKSPKPDGEGFNNSTQYLFNIQYSSVVTAKKDENIKLEISLRQLPLEAPVRCTIKHFYQDPFSGVDLIPTHSVWALSFLEAVAEKLKAAIARKDVAVRDYYDVWHIAEAGFDFFEDKFIRLFKTKLANDGYQGDFRYNFGLDAEQIALLDRQIHTDLMPVIRAGEQFSLNLVFEKFNDILAHVKYA
jgi:predicted nucleotidyltransferase component of viral defense system